MPTSPIRKGWCATGAAASISAARYTFRRCTTARIAASGSSATSRCATCTKVPVFIFQQYLANPSGTALTNTPITLAAGQAYPQFAGNVIPKNLISPVGQKLLNLLPEPNMPFNQLGQNYGFWRTIRNVDN